MQHKFRPGAPFQAAQYSSLHELLWAHKAWQDQALADAAAKHPKVLFKQQPWPPILRVELQHTVGVGNRLPSLVTGEAPLPSRVLVKPVTAQARLSPINDSTSEVVHLVTLQAWPRGSCLMHTCLCIIMQPNQCSGWSCCELLPPRGHAASGSAVT
jgi:hypothetical protein